MSNVFKKSPHHTGIFQTQGKQDKNKFINISYKLISRYHNKSLTLFP